MSCMSCVNGRLSKTKLRPEMGASARAQYLARVSDPYLVCTANGAANLDCCLFSYSTSLDLTALHNLYPILNTNVSQHYQAPAFTTTNGITFSSFFAPPTIPASPVTGTYDKLAHLLILFKTLSKVMHSWPLLCSSIASGSVSNNGSKPTMTLRLQSDICMALLKALYSTPQPSTGMQSTCTQFTTSPQHSSTSESHFSGDKFLVGSPPELPQRGGTLTVRNIGSIGAGESAMPLLFPGGERRCTPHSITIGILSDILSDGRRESIPPAANPQTPHSF